MYKTFYSETKENVPVLLALSLIRQYDSATYFHCIRVAGNVHKMLGSLGIRSEDLYQAALVHDVGKIFIKKEILNKPGKLDKKERECIDRHAFYGYLYLKDCGLSENTCKYVLFHHGIKPEWEEYISEIAEPPKLFMDILRACDIYDAITSNRPYHKAVSKYDAMDILLRNGIDGTVMKHIGVI